MKRRIQIHLASTMVVTMVAGLLLYLNMRLYPLRNYYDRNLGETFDNLHIEARGWPFWFRMTPDGAYWYLYTEWHWWHLVADILVALLILLVTAIACERWMARTAPK